MAEIFDQAVRKPMLAYVPAWIHPNHLTVARAALLVPVVVFKTNPVFAVGFLTLSSILDILDGPLARLRGQANQTGAFLDTMSDKVFVLGSIFLACGDRIPLSVRITIAAFEVVLIGARPFKNWLGARMDANAWGAAKTWIQSIGIGFALSGIPPLQVISTYVLWAAISLALLSLVFHLRDIRNRKAP